MIEIMHPQHALGRFKIGGDFLDEERGGVAGEKTIGFNDSFQLCEKALFHGQIFKDGFHHQINIGEDGLIAAAAQTPENLIHAVLINQPAAQGLTERFPDSGAASIKKFLLLVNQGDWQAFHKKVLRNR